MLKWIKSIVGDRIIKEITGWKRKEGNVIEGRPGRKLRSLMCSDYIPQEGVKMMVSDKLTKLTTRRGVEWKMEKVSNWKDIGGIKRIS